MKNYNQFMYKVNNVDPGMISKEVHENYREIILGLRQAYQDPNYPDRKAVQPFAQLYEWLLSYSKVVATSQLRHQF